MIYAYVIETYIFLELAAEGNLWPYMATITNNNICIVQRTKMLKGRVVHPTRIQLHNVTNTTSYWQEIRNIYVKRAADNVNPCWRWGDWRERQPTPRQSFLTAIKSHSQSIFHALSTLDFFPRFPPSYPLVTYITHWWHWNLNFTMGLSLLLSKYTQWQ
jgi:hypothetical protein